MNINYSGGSATNNQTVTNTVLHKVDNRSLDKIMSYKKVKTLNRGKNKQTKTKDRNGAKSPV